MLKRFSTLFALLFALSVASGWAQTFTYNASGTWQLASTWTAALGASGFPGQASNNGDVTISPTAAALVFADAPPAFPISSLTMTGTQPTTLGAGTLTITGAFTLNAGAVLNIPAGTTVVVNGASTIAGTINLTAGTSKIIFNGAVTQSGSGVITAAAAASTVQLGAGVTTIAGTLFQNPFGGTIQTGGALNLTSGLTIGAAGILNLVGTTTINSGVTLTVNNTAAGAITGAGNLQGAAANSIVDFSGGPTALQGTWFANPFNGTLRTSTAGASALTGTLTIGSTGVLNLTSQNLNPAAGANLILNNTAANSLTGTGRINIINMVTVTLGPGFNGGTLNGDSFVNPITGSLNTGGNLTATGAGTPILQFNNTNGVFNITGTLTIAAGKTIFMNNTGAGSLPGSGTFAAADNTAILRFVAGANGGAISGNIFSNPWNGRLRIDGALELGATFGATGSSIFNAGPNAILDLGGNLTVNDSLALNCTQPAGTVFPSAGFIVARTGGPSTGAPGPGGRVTVGPNSFAGFLPVANLGTGAQWQTGNLFIAGSSALNANYQFTNGSFLFLNTGSVLQVASTRTLTLDGRMLGTGRINGQDNTAIVTLTANFASPANTTDIPGANLGNPNFDGDLRINQARTLSGSLTMGPNSIYTTGGFTTTVNTPSVLTFNQTAAGGLVGAGAFIGTGTLTFGNNALGATFPVANVTSGAGNFTGRIILGDGVNFATTYPLNNPTILQLNGTTQINAGVTLNINNTAASSLTGTGRLQAQAANSVLAFAAGANGGTVPGANIATTYVGQITTAGAMNLTGNLSMGATSVLNIAGDLTLSATSQVTLGMSAVPATALPGVGNLVGQPSGTNIPEIVLSNGSLGGQLPTNRIPTGSAANQFGGRLTVGTGYAVTANTTINQPAILNIQTGAQLIVNAGQTLTLNTTTSPATGAGTGTIQGQDNTAIVSLGNGFNGTTLPGALFATPFAGQLIIPAMGLNQTGNLTMGVSSILLMNGNLNVNSGSTLTLNGGVNSLQSGGGLLNGANNLAVVALGAGFNGGTLPVNRFAIPFNGGLTTAGPLTVSASMNFGTPASLSLGGDLTIPAGVVLNLAMTGANTLTGTGRFVAGSATSQVSLGGGFNNTFIPGANFTNFGGVVSMVSALSLSSSMVLGATGALDLGGGRNTLTLGNGGASLSVVTPIRGTSATAFIITNGTGGLTINNPALTSFFFPVGTTAATYSPLSLSNASAADVFTVRARAGITNSPTTYPNFVNVEWVVSQAGSGNRNVTFAPQWASANQQGPRFNTNAVGLGLFVNNQYTETTTGATIAVTGGLTTFNGTFNTSFTSTPLVAFSKVVLPPVVVVTPIVSSITPSSIPVSNDGFTVTIAGSNLGTVTRITAQNLTNNVSVVGTITGTQLATLLTVNFPGAVRSISGVVRLTLTNATVGFTTAQITVTPISSPTLTALAPSTTASGRAFTLNLTGSGFLSQTRLSINGNAARVMGTTTGTTAAIEIPASLNNTSGTLRIRATNTDGQFAELTYTIGQAARPNILSINPRAVFVGTNGVTINVEGSGFFGPGFVTAFFGSNPINVSVLSPTRLTLTVPASFLTATGFPSILISNSDAQSIGYVFSILPRVEQGPTPVITSYTPTTTTASSRAYSVVVNGSNFSRNALVTVRGTVVTPSVLDTNRFVVEIPGGLNVSGAPLDIVLQNPDLQAVTATVAVGAALPAPVLNTLTPLTTTASAAPGRAFTITISGSNFSNATVLLNGQPLQIVSQSATQIIAIVSSNRQPVINLDPVPNNVVVLNGDGQATPAAIFTVTTQVSVLDNSLPGFSVYPSPVNDVMTIQGGFERPTNVVVTISNVIGQRVMSFTEQQVSGGYSRQVNVASLPTGTYIVEINDGARRMVQKVIKY
ncbi:MAG: T9SS type A sorting domain-containing protein [Ignavibacteria bacterium]|nr:T9SS type A sorting domain-containing protein [Ignavibacteria bacterium]